MSDKSRKRPKKRALLPAEYEIRDLMWAVGVKCQCGYDLDLFIRNQDFERVCKKCGKKYDVQLRVYVFND
jgi:hypothetical protein